jgi:hypothetical protein
MGEQAKMGGAGGLNAEKRDADRQIVAQPRVFNLTHIIQPTSTQQL